MLDKKTIIDLKKSGCSYKEIAEKLGISVGSVKSIISRYSKTIELEKESYKCKYCSQDGNDKLVTSKAPMSTPI